MTANPRFALRSIAVKPQEFNRLLTTFVDRLGH